MGLYRTLLKNISGFSDSVVSTFHSQLLKKEGLSAFKSGDTFFAEQIDKLCPVDFDMPLSILTEMMYGYLLELKTDAFIWLYGKLKSRIVLNVKRVNEGYNELVKKGNISGLEAVINLTKVRPKIFPHNFKKGYQVLVSQGRIEAIDYLQQLSKEKSIKPSKEFVQLGFHNLFISGKYSAILKMSRLFPYNPKISFNSLHATFNSLIKNGNYESACIINQISKKNFYVTNIGTLVNKAIKRKQYSCIPYIYKLTKESTLMLTMSVLKKMLLSRNIECAHFIYNQHYPESYYKKLEEIAYKLAVTNIDISLVIKICKKTGRKILEKHACIFLEKALLDEDASNTITLLKYISKIPHNISQLVLNSFLYKIRLSDKRLFSIISRYFFHKTKNGYCHDLGLFAYRLKKGDIDGSRIAYKRSALLKNIQEAVVAYNLLSCFAHSKRN